MLELNDRVLAKNIISPFDIPPFNRSTVDGYALKAEDTFGAEENRPIRLNVCGKANVGEPPKVIVARGQAAQIVTGAPIPKGANAVVMVEETQQIDDKLDVYGSVTKDENVMKKGTDIAKGERVLKAGQILSSKEIGVLAALGKAKTAVYVVPRVAVISTGAEVTEPGKKLPSAKIYDINAYSISAAVLRSGGTPIYKGVFADSRVQLQNAIEQALASADVVVTSGGVSIGSKDLVPPIVDSLGKPGIIVYGIAVKPGKPTTVSLIGNKPIFSLPGHPTSALLMYHLLVHPIIRSLSGKAEEVACEVRAVAGTRMFSARGRRTFMMVKLKQNKLSFPTAEPVETGVSGAITTLANADGFVDIAANQQFIEANEEIKVTLLNR